jgi:DNA modification methylase
VTIHYQDDTITLHVGDALESARSLSDGSVRCIVTSPPYYGLRDYGESGQYGGEASVGEYVETMTALFRELRRVLADDGTLWLNLGDSYTGSWGAQSREPAKGAGLHTKVVEADSYATKHGRTGSRRDGEPPAKNLLGVPWRVAFALQEDGWILRSDNIWAKPNPMPSSVRDRTTSSHEHVFMLAKSPRYYFDAEAISEPVAASTSARLAQPGIEDQAGSTRANGGAKTNGAMKAVGPRFGGAKYGDDPAHQTKSGNEYVNTGRANKRDVWTVPTVPFSEAHFAVYPPELIRPCILAGSAAGDTVLDPFSGSGTTGMVATEEGRKYIGFDLSAEYLDLSLRTRFAQPTLGIAVTA